MYYVVVKIGIQENYSNVKLVIESSNLSAEIS